MIARVLRISDTTKSSIKRLADYLMDPKDTRERLVCCSACNTKVLEDGYGQGICREEMDDVVLEMLHTQSMNTRAKGDRTYHLVLSFQEEADLKTIREIENEVCQKLGLGEHQRISVVHGDTDHLHVHIAVNLIHPVRHTIKTPWYDELRLLKICEEMEKKYLLIHDNHEIQSEGHSSRATTMEYCGDMESLKGWLQRNCRQEIQEAKSWEEFHAVLAVHGIRIVPSTRGLAFTNGRIHVRASTVDRSFSKGNLEKRLGPYREAENVESPDITATVYTPKPVDHGYDTGELWQQYCEERKFLKVRRREAEKALDDELQRDLSRTFSDLSLAGITARYFVKGYFLRKLTLYLNSLAKKQKAERLKRKYRERLEDVKKRYSYKSWRVWLEEQAKLGNEVATKAIQARGKVNFREGRITVEVLPENLPDPVKITRKGTYIYSDGTRRNGKSWYFRKNINNNRLDELVRLNIGHKFTVEGDEEFTGHVRQVGSDYIISQRNVPQESFQVNETKIAVKKTTGIAR